MKPAKAIQQIVTISILILFALSSITIYNAKAVTDAINLPPPITIITMEATNGTSSYFNTTLTDVPSGYDVTNTTYLGWCVDTTAEMSRSPAEHQILLFSSLNPPNGTLADQRWDMVNYILNHKQGTVDDIQAAIWYFIDFDNVTRTPPNNQTVAWAIINDTLANGTGYTPGANQTAAVICDPIMVLPRPAPIQINIIEVTILPTGIPEYPVVFITLLTFTAVTITVVLAKKNRPQTEQTKNTDLASNIHFQAEQNTQGVALHFLIQQLLRLGFTKNC